MVFVCGFVFWFVCGVFLVCFFLGGWGGVFLSELPECSLKLKCHITGGNLIIALYAAGREAERIRRLQRHTEEHELNELFQCVDADSKPLL